MNCAIISTGFESNIKCQNEFERPYTDIKELLVNKIWGLFTEGYTDFYVNCEWGIPLWTAEAVSALKMYNNIGLHIVVPYEEQSVRWSEDRRDRYYTVHAKADTVIFAEKTYSDKSYETADIEMIDGANKAIIFSVDTKSKCHAEKIAAKLNVDTKVIDLSNLVTF